MIEEKVNEIKELYERYVWIHQQLAQLALNIETLQSERESLKSILDETRERELSLINNLEQELGKKLTPNELLEIIKRYED